MSIENNFDLAELLSKEIKLSAELFTLLEEEPLILTSCDPTAIVALSQRKENLAEQLNKIEQQRCHILKAKRLPLDLSKLAQALRGNSDLEATACNNLQEIATACIEANRRNGALVENRLRYTRRALAIVTGHNVAEEKALTYQVRRKTPPGKTEIN